MSVQKFHFTAFSKFLNKFLLGSALNPRKYPFIGQINIADIVEILYANVYLFLKIINSIF
jgi:hypothetical protein